MSKYYYKNVPSTSVSSSALNSNLTFNFNSSFVVKEDELLVSLLLQDGDEVVMTLKDYVQFSTYYGIVPSDCKDIEEYDEKMLVFRI